MSTFDGGRIQLIASDAAELYEAVETVNLTAARASYRRITKSNGGDYSATLTLTRDRFDIENLFHRMLGWRFVEAAPAWELPAFTGRVETMRLYANGRVNRYTMADLANRVIVRYSTTAGGVTSTASAMNSASITRWGERWHVHEEPTAIDGTAASDLASQLVDQLGQPAEPIVIDFYDGSQPDQLQIDIVGCGEWLNDGILAPDAAVYDDLSDQVTAVASGTASVAAGVIATNTRQVEKPRDYILASRRMANLISASGPGWYYGCFGAPSLTYYQLDSSNPLYQMVRHGRRWFMRNSDGVDIPAALIQPGQYVSVPDGLPQLGDVALIGQVRHDGHTVKFSPTMADRLAQIEIALQTE